MPSMSEVIGQHTDLGLIVDYAVVTMDAPPVNAQSKEFVEQLISAFDELNATPSVRVIVHSS